ncbi:MAG: hypothetical protein KDK99_14485 [Verrucomicrobiales bacterium]|nr:hypothetical protein [Verrucomicrobiales bacterium]
MKTPLISLLLFASCSASFAVDQYWGSASGNFGDAANWFNGPNGTLGSGPGQVPNSSDTAIFDFNFAVNPYTVILSQDRFVNQLVVGGNDVSLTMNSRLLTLTALGGALPTSGALVLGRQANETGSLSLFNGTIESSGAVVVGATAGGNQTLFVDTGSVLTTDFGGGAILSDIRVGVEGIGAMTIRNGGQATSGADLRVGVNAGSVGTLSIDATGGNGSRMDVLGDAVFGELGTGYGVLSNGAILTTAGRSSIGADFASGTLSLVTLQTGSIWSGLDFEVGGLSSGQLSLSGGSGVQGRDFIIAGEQQSGVTGKIELLGTSLLTASRDVSVGQQGGTGTLEVKTGSDANITGDLRIGDTAVGNGVVLVNGAGSTVTVGDELYVGLQGTGQMTVSGGGVVTSAYGTIGSAFNSGSGLPSNGSATVTGAGSVWNNTQRLYVGDAGNGTLNVRNGGVVNATAGPVVIGRSLGGEGAVNLDGDSPSGPGGHLNATGQTVTVGLGGVGEVTITGTGATDPFNAGAARLTAQNLVIGDAFLSQGTVTVLNGQGGADNVPQNLAVANRITVGRSGTGVLNAEALHMTPAELIVGQNATGQGTVNLEGSTVMRTSGAVVVGDAGTGTLNVGVGAGSATVLMDNASLLTVGRAAGSSGTLNVGEGGFIGTWIGSQGTVANQPVFGDAGSATVNLIGGSNTPGSDPIMQTDGAILARQAGSSATMTVAGNPTNHGFATWNINQLIGIEYGEVIIGDAGSAVLNIDSHGIVNAWHSPTYSPGASPVGQRLYVLGNQAGSSGIVNVGTGGTWTGVGELAVGDGGFGQVNMAADSRASFDSVLIGNGSRGEVFATNGGSVPLDARFSAFFELAVGRGTGGDGLLDLSGATLAESGTVVVGQSGGSGLIELSDANTRLHVEADSGNLAQRPGLLVVGESGTGGLVVQDAATAQVDGDFLLGRYALGESGATARGMGSAVIGPDGTLNVGGLTVVGGGGTGGLTIQGAATLGAVDVALHSSGIGNLVVNTGTGITSTAVRVGVGGNGTALLDQASVWDATSVSVGVTGTGLLRVEGGSDFNAANSVALGSGAGSSGTLRILGTNSRADVTGDVAVGQAGAGTLEIATGGLLAAIELTAAEDAGSMGSISIAGTSSRATLSGSAVIGGAGSATAVVENGGLLSLHGLTLGAEASGSGTLTVRDAATTLAMTGALVVGDEGAGTLNLLDGQNIAPTALTVALGAGSTGAVLLQNGSVIDTPGNASVGSSGTGSITLESGSQLGANFLILGTNGTGHGTATLSGAGTRADVDSVLVVGSLGEGTLNVGTGAQVGTVGFVMGSGTGSFGAATVGIGSLITAQATTVGSNGEGELTLSLGDVTTGSLTVGQFATGQGTLTLGSGADLTVNAGLTAIGKSGQAVLSQTAGAQFLAGEVIFGENAGSDAYATLADSGTFLRADGDFYVGKGGHADVSVLGGARLETGTPTLDFSPPTTVAVIGEGAGSANSRMTVQGTGAEWVHHGNLSLGPNGAAGAELRVFSKAHLDVDGLLDIGPSGLLTLNDGRVDVQDFTVSSVSMEGVDWVKGAFYFKNDKTLDDDIDLYLLQGDGIRSGRTLGAGGNFHFGTGITLNGGVMDAYSLSSAALLEFQSGTLRLDYAQIGLGELFDGLLVYDTAFAATHKLEFDNTTINDNALVQVGNGTTFRPGALTLRGELNLAGSTARVITNIVTNEGLITGTGRILSDVFNQSGGEVRADVDERLVLQGLYHQNQGAMVVEQGRMDVSGTLSNTGAVNVVNGSLTTDGYVYNQANLSITNGTVRFDGALENSGVMQVGGAYADIFGTVNNLTGGEVRVAGSSHAYFYDDLVNNGVVQMSATSTVTSLGSLSGSGSFVGGGTVEILGDYMPGNSPGIMIVDGNLTLTPTSRLFFELAGTDRGTSYDATDILGNFTMDGILHVALSGGFDLALGAVFDLFDWDTVEGMFDQINLPELMEGWEWDLSRFESEGEIEVALQRMTYARWRQSFVFAQSGEGDALADADFDGRLNLLEYVIGSHPQIADTQHPSAPQLGFVEVAGQWFPALTYRRPSGGAARSDTVETVTYSTDLSSTSWSADDMVLHAQSDDGETETLTYRALTPVSPGTSGFLRLEVNLAP